MSPHSIKQQIIPYLPFVIEATVKCCYIQGGPKSKPLTNDQNIVLKPRFIRQIKVWIDHYNIIRWY